MLNERSRLGCLRRGSAWEFWLSSVRPLLVRVVFFPSLPFMGVMLFPNFVLRIASGEGGTLFVPLSLFFLLLSLPLLSSSSSFSFSHLFFLPLFHISFFLFPFLSHKLFPSLSYSLLFHLLRVFFFRELLVLCTFEV